MKTNLALILILYCISSKAQNSSESLIGKWRSIDGKQTILVFTSNTEIKYHLKKGIKVVPIYDTEKARYLVKNNLLFEHEDGGGGINLTLKFEIVHDTLKTIYPENTAYLFKRIDDKVFKSLTGRKP